jgi:hypothetical protein
VEFETWDDENADDESYAGVASAELERSGFHITVSWDAADQELVLSDPTEGWDWMEGLPPLCPLDAPLYIEKKAAAELADLRALRYEIAAVVADANNEGGFFGLGAGPRTRNEAGAMEAVRRATGLDG